MVGALSIWYYAYVGKVMAHDVYEEFLANDEEQTEGYHFHAKISIGGKHLTWELNWDRNPVLDLIIWDWSGSPIYVMPK